MPGPAWRRTTSKQLAYQRIHKAVRERYGPATDYDCVDCDNKAADWSHIHGRPVDRFTSYEPRCRKCHVSYDGNYPPVRGA